MSFGAGGWSATLSNLSDAQPRGVIEHSTAAPGRTRSRSTSTQASGLSRFVNWESVALTNGSRLSLDDRGVTLGDAGSANGPVRYRFDQHACLERRRGIGDHDGRAGRPRDLEQCGHDRSDRRRGPAQHVGGRVATMSVMEASCCVQSVLGADSSPSGKLVISQGAATGNTSIGVTNAGGAGALTFGRWNHGRAGGSGRHDGDDRVFTGESGQGGGVYVLPVSRRCYGGHGG